MIRYFSLLCLFCFLILQAGAQERFYVFIQSEEPVSFFVKSGNKTFNSSPAGYIILSGLTNGKQDLSIGFTNSSEPEQFFDLELKGKDRSFLLKKFNGKGWSLYDLQELSVTHALKSEPGFQLKPEEEVSSFTNLLVKASGDSTLKYSAVMSRKEEPKPAIKKNETVISNVQSSNASTDKNIMEKAEPGVSTSMVKTTISETTKQKDAMITAQNDSLVQNLNAGSLASKEEGKEVVEKKEYGKVVSVSREKTDFKPNKIPKVAENLTPAGLGIVYHDIHSDGGMDTITILIDDLNETEKPLIAKQEEKKKVIAVEKKSDEANVLKTETKEDIINSSEKPGNDTPKETIGSKVLKFLNIGAKKESPDNEEVKTSDEKPSVVSMEDGNVCQDKLSDKDFVKVRNKMALAVTDEAMIAEAKNVLRNKCITSSQVKKMSELFVTNAGKFSFFKSVYPYVSDKQYFYTLQEQLTDEHYNSRFKDILQSK